MAAHLKARARSASGWARRWSPAAGTPPRSRRASPTPPYDRLGDLPPTERSHAGARVVSQLRELGWRPQAVEGGFAAGQPQYVFQVPLAGRTEERRPRRHEPALAPQHQEGRQGGRRGHVVRRRRRSSPSSRPSTTSTSTPPSATTSPRGRWPTSAPWSTALGAEEPDRIRLYTARHEGTLVAATIAIRVGAHAWYSYGASSTEKREVRGSNAVQWQMIRDAIAAGADVYDLRGITDTLAADDPHLGLIQFKVGTGGEAVEYVGEWDLPLNRALYTAFDLYMKRRAEHEPHPHRRRRPLARPPARGRRRRARPGAGREGQRLRLHPRPAGPQGRGWLGVDTARRRHLRGAARGRQPVRRQPAGAHPVAAVRRRRSSSTRRSPAG